MSAPSSQEHLGDSCLVVLSGGQDSTTCLYWAREHFPEVRAVTFDYGQSHAIELESARRIAAMADIAGHEIVQVGKILRSTSPLLDDSTPLDTYPDFETMERVVGKRVEATFVPMRNAFFLTLAANIAVAYGCFHLVTGVDEEDNANYPDCRESFIRSQEQTINEALGITTFRLTRPSSTRARPRPLPWRSPCRAAWRPWPGPTPAMPASFRPAASAIPACSGPTASRKPASRIPCLCAPGPCSRAGRPE